MLIRLGREIRPYPAAPTAGTWLPSPRLLIHPSTDGFFRMEKKSKESLPLIKELMAVLASKKNRSAPALCRTLQDKGLDVDGSKEMLIRRLEEVQNGDGSGNASDEGSETS
jgi:hypothetical protein